MNQNPDPGIPVPLQQSQAAAAEAYRSGYLAGHLAGWRDALAAQAADPQAAGAQHGDPGPAPIPNAGPEASGISAAGAAQRHPAAPGPRRPQHHAATSRIRAGSTHRATPGRAAPAAVPAAASAGAAVWWPVRRAAGTDARCRGAPDACPAGPGGLGRTEGKA